MDGAEFDKFAEEYEQLHRANISASGETPEFFAEYKVVDVRQAWNALNKGREPDSILDFGGGVGASTPFLRQHFPTSKLLLADVSEKSLAKATARGIDNLSCMQFDGKTLPVADECVDIALAACVFHHIPSDDHVRLLREIRRVLRPAGQLLVFEHNPWNPLTVRAVNTCKFDENAVLINAPKMRAAMAKAGFNSNEICFRIFFPRIARYLRVFERHLTWLPLGAQYYVRGTR